MVCQYTLYTDAKGTTKAVPVKLSVHRSKVIVYMGYSLYLI